MDVQIITRAGETRIYGLRMDSSDRAQAKDIPELSRKVHAVLGEKPGTVLPFYVLTEAYDPATGNFSLFIGVERPAANLLTRDIPAGSYAAMQVRPMLGFAWGPAIGRMKRDFFEAWLPASGFSARDLSFEVHAQESAGKKPAVTWMVALEED